MACKILVNTVKLEIHTGKRECCVFLSILFVREELAIHPLKLKSGVMYKF